MQCSRTPYPRTGKFSPLVVDYLEQKEPLRSFLGNFPDHAGFASQIKEKESFSQENRNTLIRQLKMQNDNLEISDSVIQNIEALKKPNTFTVTTGHQLCLFTGPLYSVYKILHVISLSRELAARFSDKHFVPVFWMASEDHDFEEVNHVKVGDKTCTWIEESGNAVGRMPTNNILPVIDELKDLLPAGERFDEIYEDLVHAYQQSNLALATRNLLNKWFGKYGLVIIDGDDAVLKRLMIPAFEKELTEHISHEAVAETNDELGKGYKIQVTPREINLFYLHEGHRGRIEKSGKGFSVVDWNKTWTEDEIVAELRENPERFSPNVLLRPLYQETILPNIAYIGGGGEVAYWAQLKNMFARFTVPFPIVVLRQSVQIAPKRINRKREKLGFSIDELFLPTYKLTEKIVKENHDFEAEFSEYKERFDQLFSELRALAAKENRDFERTVAGHQAMNNKRLQHLQKRLIRSAKSKNADQNRMIEEIKAELMPGGGLQERKENIVPILSAYGYSIFDVILSAIEPMKFDFITLYE